MFLFIFSQLANLFNSFIKQNIGLHLKHFGHVDFGHMSITYVVPFFSYVRRRASFTFFFHPNLTISRRGGRSRRRRQRRSRLSIQTLHDFFQMTQALIAEKARHVHFTPRLYVGRVVATIQFASVLHNAI